MAEADMLQTLVRVVDRVKAATEPLLPTGPAPWSDHPASAGYVPPPPKQRPAAVVRPMLTDFYAQFDQLRTTITNVAGNVGTVLTNPALVPAQREKDARVLVDAARSSTALNIAAMRSAAANIVNTLTPMAMPQRPASADARQAELMRLEGQMRMVLDALPADELMPRLERFLRDAVVAKDELITWHLVASGWAQLYLESRGLAPWAPQWGQRASEIAGGLLMGEEALAARQLLDATSTADYNLETVVQAAEFYIRTGFDRIAIRSR